MQCGSLIFADKDLPLVYCVELNATVLITLNEVKSTTKRMLGQTYDLTCSRAGNVLWSSQYRVNMVSIIGPKRRVNSLLKMCFDLHWVIMFAKSVKESDRMLNWKIPFSFHHWLHILSNRLVIRPTLALLSWSLGGLALIVRRKLPVKIAAYTGLASIALKWGLKT